MPGAGGSQVLGQGGPGAVVSCLPCILPTDHPCIGELHEQQQARCCLRLQAPEPGPGKMAGTACAGHTDPSAQARALSAATTSPFQLLDTKSTDRKMTLLHFIALTVKEKYPELANFWQELHFVEKAAAGEGALFKTIPGS